MKAGFSSQILVVRLGAMGDILHALPAVGSLRQSFPQARISWVIAPKWKALLERNPDVDDVICFRRSAWRELVDSFQTLRRVQPEIAVDFQGLIQSALVGRAAKPVRFWGWHPSAARESLASLFYSDRVKPKAAHVVDRNIELAKAAGAATISYRSPIPEGQPDGALPATPFVLTHPFAGWAAKQWPLENYQKLAEQLKKDGLALVANVSPQRAQDLAEMPDVVTHTSSLEGLIWATRRCVGVVGLDSGPLHLAAALGKPGVALFGPTDPNRNGPYGGTIKVLRLPNARTTYKRDDQTNPSMQAITVEEVRRSVIQAINRTESRV